MADKFKTFKGEGGRPATAIRRGSKFDVEHNRGVNTFRDVGATPLQAGELSAELVGEKTKQTAKDRTKYAK
jgi:hypothetical protein